ncbi:DUF4920 domain-containing protein [Robertkochia flava]|uniref:DUF4920 domain-containing protein n=1 Tax=Robertkochia flava TaxID=3447986 RepID=UPI001CCA699E|nr:DUF4920 domain-containing protein [Robertkochia marina]
MKFNVCVLLAWLCLTACKSENKQDQPDTKKPAVAAAIQDQEFGKGINADKISSAADMAGMYEGMMEPDTLSVAFEAKVVEVCQMKGCWMKLDLGNDQTAMVRFKDYGFFVPKDLAGKSVVVEGNAFVDLMSVEDQKHYAEDAGSTVEDIEAIKAPKKTYTFIASGVAVK